MNTCALGTLSPIAQCLNLEREIYHTASKLRILGFEALKQALIAEFCIKSTALTDRPSRLKPRLELPSVAKHA
jgi:hypothetical protein